MTLLKKMKMKKNTSKIPNELYVVGTRTKLHYGSEKATMFLL